MATEAADSWRHVFQNWPAELARRGVLVVSFGEQIAFDDFAASDAMLAIERRAPDTVGARLVMVAYQNIAALKVTDVVKLKALQSLGFVLPTPKK